MKEATNLTGISYFIMRILYGSLIAPIVEELVFRGLLMTALSKFKKYYVDVVVSSTLFSLIHVTIWMGVNRLHCICRSRSLVLYAISLYSFSLLANGSSHLVEYIFNHCQFIGIWILDL